MEKSVSHSLTVSHGRKVFVLYYLKMKPLELKSKPQPSLMTSARRWSSRLSLTSSSSLKGRASWLTKWCCVVPPTSSVVCLAWIYLTRWAAFISEVHPMFFPLSQLPQSPGGHIFLIFNTWFVLGYSQPSPSLQLYLWGHQRGQDSWFSWYLWWSGPRWHPESQDPGDDQQRHLLQDLPPCLGVSLHR